MTVKKKYFVLIVVCLIININFIPLKIFSQTKNTFALLKYNGGGDWYANPTSLKNLILFCNKELQTNFTENYVTIDVGSAEIFLYPFCHITGHGNISFNSQEVTNLRTYLMAGGFLHIDDNYGLDIYIRREMKKVFPELDFIELPFSHLIYHQKFNFSNGLPKIHEHDNKLPKGYALIWEGRVVCFYSYETDLGDGWEDADVHNDTEERRTKALQMGANIIRFCFMQ
ncbi:MAG: DUF4159 domain-containing protein [Bacteroidales bacterium]|jgi:hypothetical protein|nr:DUF4159 domain-containing protein [Bacteroidales bacterium]